MNELDIICKCGHEKELHLAMFKEGCNFSNSGFYRDCRCTKYIADNLTYIQDLAQKKGLI